MDTDVCRQISLRETPPLPLRARFQSQTIAFLTGHSVARYVHSLALLTLLIRFTALHFAPLALLAHSIHGLAHSLAHSLVGQ